MTKFKNPKCTEREAVNSIKQRKNLEMELSDAKMKLEMVTDWKKIVMDADEMVDAVSGI